MASIIRLGNRSVTRSILSHVISNSRAISTSQKNRETVTIPTTASAGTKTETASTAAKKNWVSWGFDYKDETSDRDAARGSFFFSVTLCIVWGTFIWAYLPDTQLRDWAQREGFLELRRREAAGVDLVSPNYIDPSKMVLPSDEELGNTEIII